LSAAIYIISVHAAEEAAAACLGSVEPGVGDAVETLGVTVESGVGDAVERLGVTVELFEGAGVACVLEPSTGAF
jgi:hypothetical protein